jgi:hypothetical protein
MLGAALAAVLELASYIALFPGEGYLSSAAESSDLAEGEMGEETKRPEVDRLIFLWILIL